MFAAEFVLEENHKIAQKFLRMGWALGLHIERRAGQLAGK